MSRRKKWRADRNSHPDRPVGKTEMLQPLDLGFLDAATVTTREWKMVQIIVAGCGGTGAYLIQHIGRLMRVLYEMDKGVHLTLIDPDLVEDRNIGRQLFCDAEVGQPKAEALARRYGHAWGLNVSSYVGRYDEALVLGSDLTVLVGCVDNAAGRQELNDTLKHNIEDTPRIWWLDCGNLRDTGRVLIGTAEMTEQLEGAFREKREVVRLPGPGMQSPGLLEPGPEEQVGGEMSCAELAAANLQSLCINARIAAEAADFLARLLVTKDLKRFAWEVNLAAGTAKSKYTTPAEVAHVVRQPVEFVTSEIRERALAVGEVWR